MNDTAGWLIALSSTIVVLLVLIAVLLHSKSPHNCMVTVTNAIKPSGEDIWRDCYRAALTGLLSSVDCANDYEAVADQAAEIANIAYERIRKETL